MRLWPLRGDRSPAEPPRQGALELRLEGERFIPGEVVRGAVIAADEAAEVTVAARFHERGAGCDVVAAEVVAPALRREPIPDGVAHRFAIELPLDALPSCPSPHGGLAWTVDAEAAALGPAAAVSRPIEVAVAGAVSAGG